MPKPPPVRSATRTPAIQTAGSWRAIGRGAEKISWYVWSRVSRIPIDDHRRTGHIHAQARTSPRASAEGTTADVIAKPVATTYHHHFWPFKMRRSSAVRIARKREFARSVPSGVKLTLETEMETLALPGTTAIAASCASRRGFLGDRSNRSNKNAYKMTSTNEQASQMIRLRTISPVHLTPSQRNVESGTSK